jgi:hypothetical protein
MFKPICARLGMEFIMDKKNIQKSKKIAGFAREEVEEIEFTPHFFKIIGVAWLVIFIIGVALLPYLSKQATQYNEFIVFDFTRYNKANEIKLFWACAILSSFLVIILDRVFFGRSKKTVKVLNVNINKHFFEFLCIGILPNIILLLVTGNTIPKLLCLALFYLLAQYCIKEHAGKAFLLLIYVYYSTISIIVFLNLLFANRNLNYGTITQGWLDIASLLLTLGILAFIVRGKRYLLLDKFIMVLQFFIPFIFLNNIISKYVYRDETIVLHFPVAYYLFFFGIIVVLLIWNVILYKKINGETNPSAVNFIFPSTFVTIFAFNSYFLPAKLLQTDSHHHGEQMLAWQQIIIQGRSAYEEYIPPSGLFSMVEGFFQNVLLDGNVTDYPAAMNMVMVVFAILTILLCYYNSNSKVALLLAMVSGLPLYNRGYMMLPGILALTLPKLVKNRSLWIQVWIIVSLLGVLYYPLFGAAVALGALPFALMQFIYFLKDKKALLEHLKKWSFYASWAIVLMLVGVSVPLLLRILSNILVASSQTLLSDGINIMYGNGIPSSFFPYINDSLLRLILFYGIRLTLPAIFVAVFIFIIYKYVYIHQTDIFKPERLSIALKFVAMPIVLGVSYTFTLVRADVVSLISRTLIPVLTVCMAAFVMLNAERGVLKDATKRMLAGTLVGLVLLLPSGSPIYEFPAPALLSYKAGGLQDDTAKLKSAYVIPFKEDDENPIVLIEEEAKKSAPLLGEGFGLTSTINSITTFSDYTRGITQNRYGVVFAGGMNIYAADLKVSGSPELTIANSKSGQLSLLKQYNKEKPIFMDLNPVYYYYIYRWVMDEGYVKLNDSLIPSEYATSFDDEERKTIRFEDARSEVPLDLGIRPSELGNSLHSLLQFFDASKETTISEGLQGTIPPEGYVINFDEAIDGRVHDCLYLQLSDNLNNENEDKDGALQNSNESTIREKLTNYYGPKEAPNSMPVMVRWKTEDGLSGEVNCIYGDGKLLIQIGANTTWLLSRITELSIHIGEEYNGTTQVKVENIKLLSTLL